MGILSDAVEVSKLTGEDLKLCKKLRKEKWEEIREALSSRRDENPAHVMAEVMFGPVRAAVGAAGRPDRDVKPHKAPVVEDTVEDEVVTKVEDEPAQPVADSTDDEPELIDELPDTEEPKAEEPNLESINVPAVEPQAQPEPEPTSGISVTEVTPKASKKTSKKASKKTRRRS